MIQLLFFLLIFISSCTKPPAAAPSSKLAAKVDNRVKELDLTRITLTLEAERRLGITLAPAAIVEASGSSTIAGEILLIPGNAIIVSAPMSGIVHPIYKGLHVGVSVRKGDPLFRLSPLVGPQRDIRITYEADAQTAGARLDNASQQLTRARQLLRDLAGSQRNVDIAEQEFAQATAAKTAAFGRLKWLQSHPYEADLDITIPAPASGIVRQLLASDNQLISGGAPLVEVADFSNVWLRLPVFAAERNSLSILNKITVRDLDGKGKTRQATRVNAPPTADPLAATSDIYYELPNPNGDLNPGQRMAVLSSSPTSRTALRIPASALVYDIQGGAWVYIAGVPHVFTRQRVEVLRVEGSSALLTRGLPVGAQVVTAGVAELFGTEFGAGK